MELTITRCIESMTCYWLNAERMNFTHLGKLLCDRELNQSLQIKAVINANAQT